MKTNVFWIIVLVILGLATSLFIAGSITAYVKDYSNIVEWIKSWSVFKDEVEEVAETTAKFLLK